MRAHLHYRQKRASFVRVNSYKEQPMTQVSVVAPVGGEAIQLGPIQMRILEDGRTTEADATDYA